MKKVYKIFYVAFILDLKTRMASTTQIMRIMEHSSFDYNSPDFDSEEEAQEWLDKVPNNPNFKGIEKYFLILPCYKMEAL